MNTQLLSEQVKRIYREEGHILWESECQRKEKETMVDWMMADEDGEWGTYDGLTVEEAAQIGSDEIWGEEDEE